MKKVGVYRTVYPLYSEVWLGDQIDSYSEYQPILICRELVSDCDNLEVVSVGEKWHLFKKIAFTALGLVNVFDNFDALTDVSLIHAHFAQDGFLALPIAKHLGVPLVVTCHGVDVTSSDEFLIKSMKLSAYRYLLGRNHLIENVSVFIAVSDYLRSTMISKGFPAEKVVRHYIGVDTDRLVPRQNDNSKPIDGSFFLSIARHTDMKGLDVLLKAFSLVVDLHPEVRLVQIGGGALTGFLKQMVVELGIVNNVTFLGPQSKEDVLPYIQSCTALVLSSRITKFGQVETFGIALAEAAACGVPTIGTNVGGIPEAIVHGDTGFVIEPENATELAEKMILLFNNPDLAESMGRCGREMVCDIFDIKKQTKKLESIYNDILS